MKKCAKKFGDSEKMCTFAAWNKTFVHIGGGVARDLNKSWVAKTVYVLVKYKEIIYKGLSQTRQTLFTWNVNFQIQINKILRLTKYYNVDKEKFLPSKEYPSDHLKLFGEFSL